MFIISRLNYRKIAIIIAAFGRFFIGQSLGGLGSLWAVFGQSSKRLEAASLLAYNLLLGSLGSF